MWSALIIPSLPGWDGGIGIVFIVLGESTILLSRRMVAATDEEASGRKFLAQTLFILSRSSAQLALRGGVGGGGLGVCGGGAGLFN